MRNVCNVRMPNALGDVISGISIGIAVADSIGYWVLGIGCLHSIGLTLLCTLSSEVTSSMDTFKRHLKTHLFKQS